MALFALRRFLLAIPLLIGITFISFLVIHLAPGEPIDVQTGDVSMQSTAQARQALRELYGLDKPLHVQYWSWLTRIARLDFGRSFQPDGRPVLAKIAERLPVTLLLNLVELLIILAFAVPIGVLSATRQYSAFDQVTTVFVFVGFATPDFWLALLLMMLFGVQLGWLPISGLRSLNWEYLTFWAQQGDFLSHLILPIAVATFGGLDIMFNNAGISGATYPRFLDDDLEDFQRVIGMIAKRLFDLGDRHLIIDGDAHMVVEHGQGRHGFFFGNEKSSRRDASGIRRGRSSP
jgi:peptide/nickel transport system permease protein